MGRRVRANTELGSVLEGPAIRNVENALSVDNEILGKGSVRIDA